jgi:uncharacterized protein YjiS (DUF1127 family)
MHCCNAKQMLLFFSASAYKNSSDQCRSNTFFRRKIIMNLVRSYNAWRRYRETVSELGRLTSRELSDLGINRADIPFVARRAVIR